MEVFSAKQRIIKFVELDTDKGMYRVYDTGHIEKWNDSAEKWHEYDEHSTFYSEVKEIGKYLGVFK
jgi:hypothetical protein